MTIPKDISETSWLLPTILAVLLVTSCSPRASTLTPSPTASPIAASETTELSPAPIQGPAPTASAPSSPDTAASDIIPASTKLGIHLLLDDGRNVWPEAIWPTHLTYARQAVGDWGYVTELVRQSDLSVHRWQGFMDLCAELHLTPILRLATDYNVSAGWWSAPLQDADDTYATIAARYAAFISGLDWPTDSHYIIVGNEPNHGNEWGGTPDPAAYARFLVAVADAVHAADGEARILNAGFDPYTPHTNGVPFVDGLSYMDEETFLDEMIRARPDVFSRVDLWASHAYPLGPLTEGPWQHDFKIDMINGAENPAHTVPPPGTANRGINGYEWELFKLSTYGVGPLPVMITETGWRHTETTDPAATDNSRPLPNAAAIAAYKDLALRGNRGRYPDYPEGGWTPWLTDPRIVAVTPFALNGHPSEWGHTNWLALSDQGNVLDTYPLFDIWTTGKPQR